MSEGRPGFFEAGKTYTHGDEGDEFVCVWVGPSPHDGEPVALGFNHYGLFGDLGDWVIQVKADVHWKRWPWRVVEG